MQKMKTGIVLDIHSNQLETTLSIIVCWDKKYKSSSRVRNTSQYSHWVVALSYFV